MSQRQLFRFRISQRERVLLVLPGVEPRCSLLPLGPAHHRPKSRNTDGSTQSPAGLNHLGMFSGCFAEGLIFHFLPHTSGDQLCHLPSWPKSSIEALFCSTQFPTGKIHLKLVSTVRPKEQRGKCDVCMGMRELLQRWGWRKLDCRPVDLQASQADFSTHKLSQLLSRKYGLSSYVTPQRVQPISTCSSFSYFDDQDVFTSSNTI